ncbi:glycosyltransferase [Terrilactibacillus laevilacticus]|uniref:Glycosyltransferase n=1 Tax=Terrilactibacillus laevilacticus TaxID=1380157 RepID=A0ABW5PMC0_9BACI|nr:glycosyltransferase [Terrilactibacillus laevilacticus]
MFLSVVMAVYNGEDYLQEAIDSILNQSYKDFECIIVNDASEDNTSTILKKINDSRVIVINSKKNCGGSASLRKGIEYAKGKWIAIHDADDISSKHRFAKQIEYIKAHPGISGVGSLVQCFSGDKNVPYEQLRKDGEVNIRVDKDHIHDYRYWGNAFCHGSMIFSRKIYDQVGGYNPKYKIAYDYDLWLRMQEVLPLQKVPEVLYYWRVVSNSLGRKNMSWTMKEVREITMKYICKQRFNHLKRKPSFTIIGKEEDFNSFGSLIVPKGHFFVHNYLKSSHQSTIEKAFEHYKEKKVDAIVMIGDEHSMTILSFLQNKGLKLNENVFIIH